MLAGWEQAAMQSGREGIGKVGEYTPACVALPATMRLAWRAGWHVRSGSQVTRWQHEKKRATKAAL